MTRPATSPQPNGIVLEIGQRARERRVELGLSQEQVAQRAGLHLTFVSRVERSEREMRVTNLVRLAAALEIDPSALVVGLTAPEAQRPGPGD